MALENGIPMKNKISRKKRKCSGLRVRHHSPVLDDGADDNDSMSPATTIISLPTKKKSTRLKYTMADDIAIIKYIMEEDQYLNVKGKKLWEIMELIKLTPHTAQSMRSRFIYVIMKQLNLYNIPDHWKTRLTGNINFQKESTSADGRNSGESHIISSTDQENNDGNVSSGSDSTVNFLCLQEEKGLSYNIDESEDSSLTDEFDQHLYEQCRKQADSSHSIHALTGSNHSENQQTENNREISHTQTLQSKSSEKICFSKKATCSSVNEEKELNDNQKERFLRGENFATRRTLTFDEEQSEDSEGDFPLYLSEEECDSPNATKMRDFIMEDSDSDNDNPVQGSEPKAANERTLQIFCEEFDLTQLEAKALLWWNSGDLVATRYWMMTGLTLPGCCIWSHEDDAVLLNEAEGQALEHLKSRFGPCALKKRKLWLRGNT